MGIDRKGMLKKQAIDIKSCDWEDVHIESADEDQSEPCKFVKVLGTEHSVIALDEIGMF